MMHGQKNIKFGLFVYHLYKSVSYALDAMYNNRYLRSLAKSLTKL